jgi:hypothetical protein
MDDDTIVEFSSDQDWFNGKKEERSGRPGLALEKDFTL